MSTPREWPTHPTEDPDSRFHGATMDEVNAKLEEESMATGLDVWSVLNKTHTNGLDGDGDLAVAQLASLEHAMRGATP